MSDVTAKLGEGQKRAVITVAAVLVVGVIGVGIGRCSKGSGDPTGRSASGAGSAAADAGFAPQAFDNVEDPNWKVGVPQRDMDRDIFAAMKDPNLKRERMDDLFPDRPYKVHLIGSMYEHRFGMVIIDLTRSGKWDEKWDLRPGQVHRLVAHDPQAGNQQVEYTMVKGKWQPH